MPNTTNWYRVRAFNWVGISDYSDLTSIDIVRSQILIAQGHRLHEEPMALPAQNGVEKSGKFRTLLMQVFDSQSALGVVGTGVFFSGS